MLNSYHVFYFHNDALLFYNDSVQKLENLFKEKFFRKQEQLFAEFKVL